MIYECKAEVLIRVEAEDIEEADNKVGSTSQWDDWELVVYGDWAAMKREPHVGGGPKP